MATVRWTPQDCAGLGDITPTRNGSLSTSDSYVFANNGWVVLLAEKSGAGVATYTVPTPKTQGGLALGELTGTIAATTGDKIIGPFEVSLTNDGNGDASISFDDIAGLTVAVVRVP
ncbi:MAG: hypothetical protein Q8Q14_00740 [Gemmatimonadales bacterium]|nr:hypothetical protein [Gemmatimonadales bacterium]